MQHGDAVSERNMDMGIHVTCACTCACHVHVHVIHDVAHDVVHDMMHDVGQDVVHRVDLRAEMVVLLPPLVAVAYYRLRGVGLVVEVGRLVRVLGVYREESLALERVLARLPAKDRVLLYARE